MTQAGRLDIPPETLANDDPFALLLNQSAVGVKVIDAHGRLVQVNRELSEILGYSQPELLTMSLSEINVPDDVVRELAEVSRLLAGESQSYSIEKQCRHKQGHKVWVRVTAWVPASREPRPLCVCIVQDIQLRKQAEQALRDSEERFRTLVESSPNAVVMVDATGRMNQVNRQAESMFRYDRDQLIGQMVEVLVPARFHANHLGYRAGFVQQPQQRAMGAGRDLFAVRSDGTEFPVEIGLTPIHAADGLFVLATITDITERKAREDELRRTALELARSNQDLEQFAHVASHDLQEPLRMIMGHIDVIRRRLEGQLDEPTQQSLEFAVDGAKRMQSLIQDLLAYSRVNRAGPELRATDMNQVFIVAMGNLKVAVEEAHAVIHAAPLPTIQAENTQMVQLIQNLLGNAIKYSAPGRPPEIDVGASQEKDGWRFWVTDNGIGIAPEHRERVFMIFQRLHTREEYPGTGIGLAICKKIVERHGGRIWVESGSDKGATFCFVIPNVKPTS